MTALCDRPRICYNYPCAVVVNRKGGPQPVKPDSNLGSDRGLTSNRSERRLLTALCYDLVGSTELLRRSDVEDFHELISAFQKDAKRAITSRGGSVLVEMGDGGVALFPLEIDAKDAASLAIYAGLEIIDACKRVGRERGHAEMHVRVGIATSMALVQGSQDTPSSDRVTALALAMATRLQSMAEPDTVLVSQQTRTLARRSHAFSRQGLRQLKGFVDSESVWRAFNRRRDVDRFLAFGRLNVPFVGRAAELRALRESWDDAVAGNGGVVLIEGEAGIGKSRLLREFRRQTRRQRKSVLLFQCLPGGSNSTLHPLLQNLPNINGEHGRRLSTLSVAELFERHGVNDPEVVNVFSFLLGAEDANTVTLRDAATDVLQERVNHAVRRSVELVCATSPVILAVEDIHWIDPTSQQLLMEIARLVHKYPLLLIVTTRPKVTSEWLQVGNPKHISIHRLDPNETRIAVTEMWPNSKSSARPELLDLINRITGGVPLFIEEICQWMAENPSYGEDQLAKAISPNGASILQSILDARLEPLGPARDVARAASVAGIRFNLALLRELLPEFGEELLLGVLDQLSEAGILAPTKSLGAGTFTFRHALIQETIYNALLRKARQTFHQRIYAALSGNRDLAAWIGTATLAGHAEQAGLLEEAVSQFTAAGKESSARSAMTEARSLLEHALDACERITDPDRRDTLRLSGLAALGPVLTSAEGSGSPRAQKLYEDGIEIARRRPAAERASLFPIYWGWWFTGADVDNKRAQAIFDELKDVEDPEVQLQLRHCIWAIDFYLGRHESCIAAVNAGVPLYGTGHGRENVTLFGGHDAKVCGLSHRGLSEWLTGHPTSAMRSVVDARHWALETGHIVSIAHAYHNQAMLNCYRRDFPALRSVIADFRQLTEKHSLRSLAATFAIFEGWCEGSAGNYERGQDMIKRGLAVHAELQTPEDYPVYCGMLAELMTHTGDLADGLELLSEAEIQAERSGHRYWLAELHHRRARLLLELGSKDAAVAEALGKSLEIAAEQNAVPLLLGAYDTLVSLKVSDEIEALHRQRVEVARSKLESGIDLIVNPEPVPRRRSAAGGASR